MCQHVEICPFVRLGQRTGQHLVGTPTKLEETLPGDRYTIV